VAYVFYLRNIEGELNAIEKLLAWIVSFIPFLKKQVDEKIEEKKTADMVEKTEEKVNTENKPKVEKNKWDTPAKACHSFRVICDEVGLSVNEKNMLAKVLNCESGFNVKAVHKNNDARKTIDYGIAQFNDYWYKNLITPDEALNDPEKAVRLFISEYRSGRLKNWVCYKSKKYLNFQSKVV